MHTFATAQIRRPHSPQTEPPRTAQTLRADCFDRRTPRQDRTARTAVAHGVRRKPDRISGGKKSPPNDASKSPDSNVVSNFPICRNRPAGESKAHPWQSIGIYTSRQERSVSICKARNRLKNSPFVPSLRGPFHKSCMGFSARRRWRATPGGQRASRQGCQPSAGGRAQRHRRWRGQAPGASRQGCQQERCQHQRPPCCHPYRDGLR